MSFLLRRWLHVVGTAESLQGQVLGSLAKKCARHYRVTLVVAFFVMALLGLGILNFHESTEVDDLWVDVNGETVRNRRTIQNTMNTTNNAYGILILIESNASPPVDDIITAEHLREVFDFDTTLRGFATPSNGKSLQDLCVRSSLDSSVCTMDGVLRFWNANQSLFDGSTTDIVKQVMALEHYADGGIVDRSLDMASFRIIADNPGKAAASGLTLTYVLRTSSSTPTQAQDIREFIKLIETEIARTRPLLSISFFHSNSIDDALAGVVGRDIDLLIITFTLMIVTVSLTLGRPSDKIESRYVLASQSVILVVLASFTGYLFCFAIGIPFTNLQQILPFLLLGIGIDDAYVVAAALDHTPRSKDILGRIEEAYRVVGVSITVTSLTDIVALLFSLTSRLPAVRIFGVYAAVSITFIYLAFLTVFPVLLLFDETRRAKRKLDLAPCIVSKAEHPPYSETTAVSTPSTIVEDWLVKHYVPIVLNNYVKAIVLVVFVGFTAWMGYNITRIDTAFPLEDLTPPDSAAFKYLTTHKRLYNGLETPDNTVSAYFGAIDYADGTVQANMARFIQSAQALELMNADAAPRNWHDAFSQFVRTTPPFSAMPRDPTNTYLIGEANFYLALDVFLADPAAKFVFGADIARSNSTGKILMSRVLFITDFLASAQQQISAFSQCRKLEANSTYLHLKPFFHDGNMVFWEQNSFMVNEAVSLFSMTLAAVAIITAFTLVHPTLVMIITLTLGMIFVDILGLLPITGVKLNSISVANLVMGIGIVVDPSAHIAHSFGQQDASLSRHDRVSKAMKEIGGSVIMGASTTFLGVLPTVGANSEIFKVFFRCFVIVVLVGLAHGLIWLPVVLSWCGASFGSADHRSALTVKQGSLSDIQADTAEAQKESTSKVDRD